MGETKRELLTEIRTAGDEVASKLRSLPAEGYEQGRYENGWNGRQILAHVASIEWTYARLIDVARGEPQAEQRDVAAAPRPAGRNIGSYNDRQVEKREGMSVDELIAEFEENRAKTLAAVESADDELLSKQVRSAGGLEGTLAQVMRMLTVFHVQGHLRDITGGA